MRPPPLAREVDPSTRWILTGVLLLAALVFAGSLGNGFAQDDVPIIERNAAVHGIGQAWTAIRSPYWPETPAALALYRPVVQLSYALEWTLWSGSPRGFHLTNVLLHVAVTGAVWFLLIGAGLGVPAAGFGAAVFAVHPVHVEAVANVVGRAELLAALFVLLALLVHRRSSGPRWGRALAVGGLTFLAVGSKESAFILPALLPLALLRPLEGRRGLPAGELSAKVRQRWPDYLACVAALGLHLLLRQQLLGVPVGGDLAPWFRGEPTSTRLWTSVRLWPEYLRLLVLPARLLPDYAPGVILPQASPFAPGVLLGWATGVGAACLAWWSRARMPALAVGILWFAVAILPASGLLFENAFLLAERTLYLPSVGLSLAAAAAAQALLARRPGAAGGGAIVPERTPPGVVRVAAIAAVVILALLAARTWVQVPVWKDDATLFGYLLAAAPENYRSRLELAQRYDREGRFDQALGEVARAAALVPGHFNVRLNHGQRLLQAGRPQEAIGEFEAAAAIAPGVEVPHLMLLTALGQAGQLDEVRARGPAVLARFPASALAHHFVANALAGTGELGEARLAREEAIRLDRGEIGWPQWVHLALIELAAGEEGAARDAREEAVAQAPAGTSIPDLEALAGWVGEGRVLGMPNLLPGGG